MKPQDLFILYCALDCKSKNLPLSSINLIEFGWDPQQMSASQRRLQHLGLLDRTTALPRLDRIRLFLLETLSFWWPSAAVSAGQGLALSIPAASSLNSIQNKLNPWVWPCPGERVEGDMIRPLWPELPKLCSQNRDMHEFFSLVEVLRFDEHEAKPAAQACMRRYLDKVQQLGNQNFPDTEQDYLDLEDEQFETLVNFICLNGFRALTLQKASLLTHLPVMYFLERWETDQALRLWIAGKYHDKVFQFLNPLLDQLHDMNKGHLAVVLETFLDYIESNEDYYRMNIWTYLENDVAIQEMSRRGQQEFFKATLTLFKKSKPEAVEKAEFYSYLFSTMWRLYAGLIWIESKSLPKGVNLVNLKRDVRNLIIRTVFEEY